MQIESLLEGKKIAEPMRYISNGIIAFSIAFLINFMFVLISSKVRKASNNEILSNSNIKFNLKNISAVKTGTSQVYSPRSDSSSSGGWSSGGSSGGGFSGGGSSGGGGGHSF